MKTFFSAATILCALVLAAGPVSADQVVKRVSCKDHDSLNKELRVLSNQSETGIRFQIQIIRDGCSPKLNGGNFNLRFNDGTPDAAVFTRSKRHTDMITAIAVANSHVGLSFLAPGQKVRGSFDYVISVN